MVKLAIAAGLCLLAGASPLTALPAPAAPPLQDTPRKAVQRLEKLLEGDQAAITQSAIDSLARVDDPVAVDGMLTVLERGEAALHAAARRALGSYTSDESRERLVSKGLKHREPRVRAQVLMALAEARPAALDWTAALQEGLDDASPVVRAVAVRELGRARADARVDRIIELAGDPYERVRAEVPGALTRLGGPRALQILKSLLHDPRWRVRLEAIHGLEDLRTTEGVEALVESLSTERGRLQEDVVLALESLTGANHGFDLAAWRDFLQRAPPDYLSKTAGAKGTIRTGTPKFGAGGIRYHTIGTASQRFVMITDLSGSMDAPIRLPGSSDSKPRIELVRNELSRLIESLDDGIAFDLVTFRDDVVIWKPQMLPVTNSNQRAALREVQDYKAFGGTNIHGALKAVFDLAERAMDDPGDSLQDVDTIFLLSDGAPSAGAVREPALLLKDVAERNQTLRLRIHCISLVSEDEAEARNFLVQLAATHGGHYTGLVTADQ